MALYGSEYESEEEAEVRQEAREKAGMKARARRKRREKGWAKELDMMDWCMQLRYRAPVMIQWAVEAKGDFDS